MRTQRSLNLAAEAGTTLSNLAIRHQEELTMKSSVAKQHEMSPYISPNDLAERWQCSRSTVDRIARREGFTRVCLGAGANGIVRYLRKEVAAYEETKRVTLRR